MKNIRLLLITVFIISSGLLVGQEITPPDSNPNNSLSYNNFSKGKMQVGIEGISFGFGYGRVIASVGLRYGYFVANNSLLFINGEAGTWGEDSHNFKLGLHFRQYFSKNKLRPYVQLGASSGWNSFYNQENSMFGEITLGGGVSYQVKKINFDMGMQLNIWDNVSFKPAFGVSYSF